MKQPLVSIIIPTYNRAHLIGETLDSVLAQTYTNWECIVVDDGSTDNTAFLLQEYCEKDPRFQYHHRPEDRPKGANACRNYGFELSKGEYVNWLDSDDLLDVNHFRIHVQLHQKNNHSDAIVTDAQIFYDGLLECTGNSWSAITSKNDMLTDMIFVKTLWPIGSVSWKKACLKFNPFNERLYSSQEWEFHLNQLIRKRSYKLNQIITCFIRSHENRIGKDMSKHKIFSTYYSRYLIFSLLKEHHKKTPLREKGLINFMFTSLRDAISFGYYIMFITLSIHLLKNFFSFNYKRDILRVLFFNSPIFFFVRKGETKFKVLN